MLFKKSIIKAAMALMLGMVGFGAVSFSADVLDKVIVVVNDEVITQREFDRAFDPVKKAYETNFKGEELDAKVKEARKALLDQIVNIKLAISLAKQQKLEVDQTEVQARIDKVKSFYPTEEEFLKALEGKGTNLTEFRKEISEQMMAQKIVDQEVASKIVITPSEINDLYEKNKSQLIAPRNIELSGIMVRKSDDTANDKKRLEAISKKLSNGGDFNEIAKSLSEGPYAENGGKMGKVVKGQLLAEMDKVVFAAKEGDITEVVETPIGYHIFKIGKIEEPRQMALQEVSDFLRSQLFKKKFTESLTKWIAEKKKNVYISYK